jgi:predicted transcriptional regulator
MSVKEELHRLVDNLPEDEAAHLLKDLREELDDEPLTPQDLAAIQRGLDDVEAGRSITLTELKQKYGL